MTSSCSSRPWPGEVFCEKILSEFDFQPLSGIRALTLAPNVPGPVAAALPRYNIYRTVDGWVVLAALESHFWERLQGEIGLCEPTQEELGRVFLARRSLDWEEWASTRDLPLVAVPDALFETNSDVLEEVARCAPIT